MYNIKWIELCQARFFLPPIGAIVVINPIFLKIPFAKVQLGDAETPEHIIIFHNGEMIDILCPNAQAAGEDE